MFIITIKYFLGACTTPDAVLFYQSYKMGITLQMRKQIQRVK